MVKIRKKKLNSSKFSIYLDIYHNGTRRYEFLKLYLNGDRTQNKEIMRLAEGIRAKREIELRSIEYGFIPDSNKKINFVDYMMSVAKDKNKSSRNMFKSTINYINSFTKGSLTISMVDENWLKNFENFLSDKLSRNTTIDYMHVISITLNCAVREKIILTNPFKYLKKSFKKQETIKQYLTHEELQVLSQTKCNHSDVKRAFLFACFTGLRISDILNLKWENVRQGKLEIRQHKTKTLHYIPLSNTALSLLKSNENIIEINEGKVFKLPDLRQILTHIDIWVKKAGINKHITTHSARHTFATLSLTNGVDLFTVSKLLGHADIKTTQIYTKIIDEKKVEAVNKLPELIIA